MSWYTRTKYDCRSTTMRIEKQQSGSINIRDMISMYTHLFTCPFCRLYKKQTGILRRLLKKALDAYKLATLDAAYKAHLQRMIEDRIR